MGAYGAGRGVWGHRVLGVVCGGIGCWVWYVRHRVLGVVCEAQGAGCGVWCIGCWVWCVGA